MTRIGEGLRYSYLVPPGKANVVANALSRKTAYSSALNSREIWVQREFKQANIAVTDGIKKKNGVIVGVFVRTRPTKGVQRLGCYGNSIPTFSHPKTLTKKEKNKENEEDRENPMKLRRGQTLRNRRKNLHFTQQK